MTHLVDDLLDLGRITRDQLTLRRERVDLSLVIRSAVETSQPLITESGHELIVSLPEQPVHVDGDLTRLSQVFANLLNNAAKFTDPGGRIQLTARIDGGDVVAAVQDNGVGMPSGQLSSIFEMFTHIDQGTDRSYGGLGIGLTLVRRLVELHGGSVIAESDGPGHGSVLTVRLPRLLETVEQPRWMEKPAETGGARYRILIVDDNRDSADMLGVMLGLKGHTVQAVYDGSATFEVGATFAPDVVLLDLGMPRPDGFEVCRRLRKQPWGAHALVIAVTGWGQTSDRRRTREAGFDDHLVKPLEPTALDAVLARHRAPETERRPGIGA
jgi:CheY-like chemotaxis protein